MAGTEIEIDVSGLDKKIVNSWLSFCHDILHFIGLHMEVVNYPNVGEDILLVFVDGPFEAFVHRLDSIIPYSVAFAKALSHVLGDSNLQYFEKIFLAILKECKRFIGEVDELINALQSKDIKAEALVVSLPPILLSKANDPSSPENVKMVTKELSIAITLLHDRPYDPTLSLIVADRAAEILLKDKLGIDDRISFPRLVDIALEKGLLTSIQAVHLKEAHKDRNVCQHQGIDIDFQKAWYHVKKIVETITDIISE